MGVSAFLKPSPSLRTTTQNPSCCQHCKFQRYLPKGPLDSTTAGLHHFTFALGYNQNDNDTPSSSSDNIIIQTSNTIVDMIQHRAFTVVNQQLRREKLALQNQKKKQMEEIHRNKKNLELKWNIEKSNEEQRAGASTNILSDPCETCQGKGKVLCAFCHGDGFVDFGKQEAGTIGGTMVSKNGGRTHVECPVCDENGEQCCTKCSGSGWIAKWNK